MSTIKSVLNAIPTGLRGPLISSFRSIEKNYREHRFEPSELNGGKFAEITYWILHGYLTGTYVSRPSKPRNVVDACRGLEQLPRNDAKASDRSCRILIPRVLIAMYEIRNNRGVGHVGGDVNPNLMDATIVLSMASWVIAELVRLFHSTSTEEAQQIVEGLSERRTPLVWEVEGVKRVLSTGLSARDESLLLLYVTFGWVDEATLRGWVEYTHSTNYRNKVLAELHDRRLIEYDKDKARVLLSPTGSTYVEERIMPNIN